MCIISIAPKGTEKDSEQFIKALKRGMEGNRSGSGYAFLREGETQVTYNKGFFEAESLFSTLQKENLQPQDVLVVHHRIRTHGLVSEENCHPYSVEDPSSLMGKTAEGVLAHNGVLSRFTSWSEFGSTGPIQISTSIYSDSYMFVKYVLGVPEFRALWLRDPTYFAQFFNGFIGGSRLAFLHPSGLYLTGNWVKDGLYLHSNGGYCSYDYTYGQDWTRRTTGFDHRGTESKKEKKHGHTDSPDGLSSSTLAFQGTRKLLGPKSHATIINNLCKALAFLIPEETIEFMYFKSVVQIGVAPPGTPFEILPAKLDTSAELLIINDISNHTKSVGYSRRTRDFFKDFEFIMDYSYQNVLRDLVILIKKFNKGISGKKRRKLKQAYDACLINELSPVLVPVVNTRVDKLAFIWFCKLYVVPSFTAEEEKIYLSLVKEHFGLDCSSLSSMTFMDSIKIEEIKKNALVDSVLN